jgi:hypothetical protein
MRSYFYSLNEAWIGFVCLVISVCFSNVGCRTSPDPYITPSDTGLGFGDSSVVDPDGAVPDNGPCTPAVTGARVHTGNFDTKSCNVVGCHSDFVGGWLYTDSGGETVVGEATITVTNEDGTVVTAVAASDGFFSLIGNTEMIGKIAGSYKVCVSKCPNTVCSTTPHTNNDCQISGCHGGDSPKIYLTQNTGGANAGSGGASGCAQLASGGPKVHNADSYDSQSCRICHGNIYTGGFLYDGVTSNRAVARATVTLTPKSGPPLTAVTGPGGMFYYSGIVKAPYTVCASKCQDTVCSDAGTHTTTDDCRTCHDETTRIHLP